MVEMGECVRIVCLMRGTTKILLADENFLDFLSFIAFKLSFFVVEKDLLNGCDSG